MEIISGVSGWKLTVRREGDGITVLRAAACRRPAGDAVGFAGDGPG